MKHENRCSKTKQNDVIHLFILPHLIQTRASNYQQCRLMCQILHCNESVTGKQRATRAELSFPQAQSLSKKAVGYIKPYRMLLSAAGYICQFL